MVLEVVGNQSLSRGFSEPKINVTLLNERKAVLCLTKDLGNYAP